MVTTEIIKKTVKGKYNKKKNSKISKMNSVIPALHKVVHMILYMENSLITNYNENNSI
jgi:hypothetical protein